MKLTRHTISLLTLISILLLLPSPLRAGGDSDWQQSDHDLYFPAIIQFSDPEADSETLIAELKGKGVRIFRQRRDMLLCCVPRDREDLFQAASRGSDLQVEIVRGRYAHPVMDKARQWFDAGLIHSSQSSPFSLPYTGAGVVTGICDIGFDPSHIAFRDSEGRTRVRRVTQYREDLGTRLCLSDPEEFDAWKTDNENEWHATHVANILAGGFGEYHGMAPEADLVVSTSCLSDVGLLCGAEDILEYADSVGKRAVINMSMANYTGPHDGTSLFSRYLDLIGEEAVVVLSAGNGGNTAGSLPFTFSEQTPSAALAIYSTDWVQFNPYGLVDIWSADSSQVKVRLGILDSDRNEIVKLFSWESFSDGERITYTNDPDLSAIFSGLFALSGELDPANGRHHMLLEMNAHTEEISSWGKWARYVPVIEVAGDPGTQVDIYADGTYTVFRRLTDGPVPGSELSFSDLATGQNTISVGMFVNRATFPLVNGETYDTPQQPGTVEAHSSYSTLRDGRVMPLTVAPGNGVISAISTPYLNANPDDRSLLNGLTVMDGRSYGWITTGGTSMSAPYVAGTLACWLEALPTLSTAEIMDYIGRSNRHDYPDAGNPRHGRGWFDAIGGLKLAFQDHAGLPAAPSAADGARLSFGGNTLTVFLPTASGTVDIFDIAGRQVSSFTCSESIEQHALSSLPSGIYLVRIRETPVSLKIAIR